MDTARNNQKARKEGLTMQTLTVAHRPVTPYIPWSLVEPKREPAARLTGLPASAGIVEGRCTVITNLDDVPTLPEGTILVCKIPSPTLVPHMSRLRGLVAEQGGPLCIASGYARACKIPAVVGLNGVTQAIHSGDIIRIDGSRGTVEIVG